MFAFPPFIGFVRQFVITCAVIYVAGLIGSMTIGPAFSEFLFTYFGLSPSRLFGGMLWQPVSWVFLHSLQEPFHIIFNLLAFWMFGSLVEHQLGSLRFIKFCVLATLFCAVSVVVLGLFDEGTWFASTVGASGIVYAVLVAVARMFPNQTVIFLIFPMKMKYLAMILIGINVFYAINPSSGGGNISYIAHLGGALFGYIYISWLNSQSGGQSGGGGEDWLQKMKSQWDRKKKKRHLRIVTPDEKEDESRWHAEAIS